MANRRADKGNRSRPMKARIFFGCLVAAVAVTVWLASSWEWPIPGKANVHPDRDECPMLRDDDDLVRLAFRSSEDEARQHLARWSGCDDKDEATLTERAKVALNYDYVLVVALASTVFTASLLMRRQTRWRLAANVGFVLAFVYAGTDTAENMLLRGFLDGREPWSVWLPIMSAVKFGTLIAALPLVGGALFVFLLGEPPPRDLARGCRPPGRFWLRWKRRRKGWRGPKPVDVDDPGNDPAPVDRPGCLRSAFRALARRLCPRPFSGVSRRKVTPEAEAPVAQADTPKDEPILGVCCSGGGIRSAAFSLGALQALDDPQPSGGSEFARARWLFAVSGGSYLSAAWVTARAHHPKAWARESFEEKFLRRHASYLAPGMGGKAWALLWYLLALIANVGLVVVVVGALFVPIGWLIATGMERLPVEAGVVTLTDGGCIELADGSLLAALPGTSLNLTKGARVQAARGVVVPPPKAAGESKATATAEGAPPARAVAVIGGTTTTTTTIAAGDADPSCPRAASGTSATGPSPTVSDRPADGSFPVDEDTGALRGDAAGQLFEEGTRVPIWPGPEVEVRSGDRRVSGCRSPVPEAACRADAAQQHVVPSGSRLVGAPAAHLTLESEAIVASESGRRLDRACGIEPCDRFQLASWLSWLPWSAVALLVLSGLALVTMREDPDSRAAVQVATKWVAVAVGLVVLSLWALPQLVVSLGRGRSWLEQQAGVVGSASGGTILLALLAQLRAASAKSDKPSGKVPDFIKAVGGRFRPFLLRLAALVAAPALLILTALLFASYGASFDGDFRQVTVVVVMAGWLVIFGACGDLNRWSLHPYYRERLRSAFAVNRQGEPRDEGLVELPSGSNDLRLIICATANLADARITAPGRPAVPWTFSADQMGSCPGTGCYSVEELPDRFDYLKKVWTSVAVSGAAFAPAMGKMSRPERFLMALGNLRLGLWYPNPIYFQPIEPGSEKHDFDFDWYQWHHPRLWYLFKEALGLHKLRDPWVYVTDGGHYENLGLVELLRTKRCREVYCFDAAGDATHTFDTFADAQRLARQEWQIEIDLDPRAMTDENGISKVGVWAGTVNYPEGDPGWLVVAKLAVPLSAPFDLLDRARTLPSFPTHPTADQLYTDEKFEAYRALGHHLGREALAIGGELRRMVAKEVSVYRAVEIVNKRLCETSDPHPCPPANSAGKVEKDAE